MQEYILDIQGFQRPMNQFTIKEIAILPRYEDNEPLVYLFKPPYEWDKLLSKYKSSNKWLTHNHHGLHWEVGDIPYDEIEPVLFSVLQNATKIYVKGHQKKKLLETMFSKIIDLEDLGCPKLAKSPAYYCSHHSYLVCKKAMCAAYNVKNIKSWMRRNALTESVDEVDV